MRLETEKDYAISLQTLYENGFEDLFYDDLKIMKKIYEDGNVFYDLCNQKREVICFDGEMCRLIARFSNEYLFKNDGVVTTYFRLSQEEVDNAIFINEEKENKEMKTVLIQVTTETEEQYEELCNKLQNNLDNYSFPHVEAFETYEDDERYPDIMKREELKQRTYIKITYSWGDEELPIYVSKEEARDKMIRLALQEIETVTIENGHSAKLIVCNDEVADCKIEYDDNTTCFYKIINN